MPQLILRPVSPGDETSIPTQYPATGDHWDKVDESVSDDSATTVSSSVGSTLVRDLYAMADTGQQGAINWVRVYIRVYTVAGGYARTELKSGSNVYSGNVQSIPSGAWVEYYTHYATMDGLAWTWAKVNAAQAGLSLAGTDGKGSGVSGTQVWMLVDFTDSSPQTISPLGIVQALVLGLPSFVLFVKPLAIVQSVNVGQPALSLGKFSISPGSTVVTVSVGAPSLSYSQIISPSGIVQGIDVGQPILFDVGILKPSGIIQQVSFGIPTLHKYVWHVILDGQYAIDTPEINRSFVIGQDQNGYPVYGSAEDSAEMDLVGERLDCQQELAIPTDSQAASVAEAILSKMRLIKAVGVILIPPNCGQELFDVVQISDSGANQSVVKFRVVGIRFEYNPRQAKYEHRLLLGAP